jgi:hypothetical protein
MKNKVILKEDFFFHEQYYKGDIFTIIGEDSIRGLDLQCERNDRIIYECRFIQDKFDYYDIKKDRKKKLNKINSKL